MKIRFINNAMVSIEGSQTRILCDPWVTFDNHSTSGFYNFPKVEATKEKIATLNPDYIYISHTHPDHFDEITLNLFPKDTKILVANYKNNFTAREIKSLGFENVIIVPDSGMRLNGNDYVWIEPAEHSPEIDSLAVFKVDGKNIVNVNDNTFSENQCCRIFDLLKGEVDIGLLPSGAHGPWPMFFENYTPEEKFNLAEKRANNLKENFYNYIRTLKPKFVVPFAGGICAAGEKVKEYKYSGISSRSEAVLYAKEKIDFIPIFLSEWTAYDFINHRLEGDYVEKTFSTESKYLEELRVVDGFFSRKGMFFIDPSLRIDLTLLLKKSRLNLRKWQERYNSTSTISFYFDVGEETVYRLSLKDDEVFRCKREDITEDRYEIYTLPYELLYGMLTRHFIWSNVNTQFMTFYRKGEGMDNELMMLINYLQV